uniref:CG8661 protein n=1 Tax=Parastrongyloides trichosuri TaxID=131310 RepID=A0A0N4ZQJ6_PARTI
MQFFNLIILASFIAVINACAQTRTVTSATAAPTTVVGRKRRSVDESIKVTFKSSMEYKNDSQMDQFEKLVNAQLTTLFASNLALSETMKNSSNISKINNGKFSTTVTIPESSSACNQVISSVVDILKNDSFIQSIDIQCGEEEPVTISK